MTKIAPLLLFLVACGGTEAPADAPEKKEMEKPAAKDKAEKATDKDGADKGGDHKVFFVEPKDGATVKSPVSIKFGIEGMEVKPAGTMDEGTGHHHLIIGPAGVAEGTAVPADETHIHFGKGQTETEVELKPGKHKLTMQFADGAHISYGDKLATTIEITVEE